MFDEHREQLDVLRQRYPSENSRIFDRLGAPTVIRNPYFFEVSASNARRKLLDTGCSTGDDARFLANDGFDAYGVDIDGVRIRIGNEYYSAFPGNKRQPIFLVRDARQTSFRDCVFDVVYSSAIIPALDEKSVGEYLREMHRVLAASGWLFGRALRSSDSPRAYLMSEAQLSRALSDAGFANTRITANRRTLYFCAERQ